MSARTVAPSFTAPTGTELVDVVGNGSVFQVARVKQNAEVLICKRLTPRNRAEPAARAALAREATSLSMVDLPNVPRVREVGKDGHGPFVLESLVSGVSLRALVEHYRGLGAPVPRSLAVHIAATAARALTSLHEATHEGRPAEIVHGDLSPDNLVFDSYGRVGLIDFGGARFRGMKPELDTADRGTLPYVAPEVARGDVRPDAAADVYALAASLLFLFLGRPLLPGTEEAALLVVVGERGLPSELFEADGLPASTRDALRAALRFDRAARARDARDLERMPTPG